MILYELSEYNRYHLQKVERLGVYFSLEKAQQHPGIVVTTWEPGKYEDVDEPYWYGKGDLMDYIIEVVTTADEPESVTE